MRHATMDSSFKKNLLHVSNLTFQSWSGFAVFFSDWYNEEVLFKKGKFSLFTQREMQLSKFKRLIVRYLWFENIWGQENIFLHAELR